MPVGGPGPTSCWLWQLVRAEWLAPCSVCSLQGPGRWEEPGEVGGAQGGGRSLGVTTRCWKAVETFLAAGFSLTPLVSPMAKSGD